MPTPTQNRRKRLLVNRPFQGRLILSMTLVPMVMLLGVAASSVIYVSSLDTAFESEVVVAGGIPMLTLMLGFQLLAGYFMLIHALRASHRVAGPAYRICKSIERIRGGDIDFRVRLREGDHLVEIEQELNRLIECLQADRQRRAAACASAEGMEEVDDMEVERSRGPEAHTVKTTGQC